PETLRNAGSGIHSLLRDGTGHRIFCRPKLGASGHQSLLLAHVVLLRPVDAVHVPAALRAKDCANSAALSLVAIGLQRRRHWPGRTNGNSLADPGGIHTTLHGCGMGGTSTR